MNAWLTQHANALRDALRRLVASPLNTALSLFVIGIALTLPAAGWLALDNLRDAVQGASGVQQLSLFMTLDADRKAVAEIETRLRQTDAGPWRFVAREEALKRLQGSAGMGEIVASLPRNPLPDAFIVEPRDISPAALDGLAKEITSWPKVAHVQLDAAWVKRFDALLRIGKLAIMLLGGVLAAALVAVTFNTIRLQIVGQAAEIEVARLIGATDAWIRRPFYYFGALQGALGGLFAALLLIVGTALLTGPVGELATLYGASFALHGPGPGQIALLGLSGALLGWLGAQISVSLSLG